jgi:fumarylacetoacetase
VSGGARESWASLLELTQRGKEPIALPDGETRGYLADGDEVIFRGHCTKQGFARIGFGECRAVIAPATA